MIRRSRNNPLPLPFFICILTFIKTEEIVLELDFMRQLDYS